MTTRLSCLLIGEDTLLIGCGEALIARGHAIAGVASGNDKLLAWARKTGVPAASRAEDLAPSKGKPVDWLLSIANPAPIPAALHAQAVQGAISFHDGPLPECAGPNTPAWALMSGAATHGVTWHLVEGAEQTNGDILWRTDFPIASDDTAFTLNAKCYAAGLEGFEAVLDQIGSGKLDRRTQDRARRRAGKPDARPEAAGRLDFTRPASDVARFVRALDFGGYWNPLGRPKIKAGGRLLLVGTARAVETLTTAEPGTVLSISPGEMTVATGEGAVRLGDFADISGQPLQLYTAALEDAVLASPEPEEAEALRAAMTALAAHEPHWRARLAGFRPARLALAQPPRGLASWGERRFTAPKALDEAETLAALAAWALHNTGDWGAGLAYASAPVAAGAVAHKGYVSSWVPLTLALEDAAAAPAETLARALAGDFAAAEAGGFPADLIARDPGLVPAEIPAIGLSRKSPIEGTALTLALDGARITLWHDARLIEDAALTLLTDRLALFLDRLAAAPERPLRDHLVLPPRERALTLTAWNATRAETDLTPVPQAFEAQVDRTPDVPALVFNDRTMSYAELDGRANALAHRLIAEGAKPGDRIGIYLARSFELTIAALAVHKVGAAYVPLDPAYPADRLAHYVTDSQAAFVVTDLTLASGLPASDAVPVMVPGGSDPRRPAVEIPPEALAYVIYTSGSTGTPKGVQVEHRNLANFFTGMDRYLAPGGTWLAVTSLGFDISVLELFYTLTRGYKVVIVSEAARVTLSEADKSGADFSLSAQLTRHKATVLQCTPSMGRMILADEAARAALSGLTQILLGGEAVTASLTADIRALTPAQIVDMYGPTETTIWSTAHAVTGTETGVVPIGKPLANQTAYVLDAQMQPVPVGLPGELWIGGLGVTRGYWQRDDLNADRFRPDPFAAENGVAQFETPRMYGTGDLVRWRADGVLDFLGRTDHQVKIRGQRLELGEIEARINRAVGVRQAVVVPKGEGAETRLVAYLEETGPGAADIAGIRAELVANLPEVMVPAQFMALAALPLTPNRKVDRKALPEPDAATRIERAADSPPPEAGLESQISAIWAAALGPEIQTEDIRADDSFFALGGHSLLAVEVHKKVRALPGLEATAITEIFRFPVLRDLAAHLAEKTGAARPAASRPSEPATALPGFDRDRVMARRREMRLRSGRVAA